MSTMAATPAGFWKNERLSVAAAAPPVSCVNARAGGDRRESFAAVAAASGLVGTVFASPADAGGAEKASPMHRTRRPAQALMQGVELRLTCISSPSAVGGRRAVNDARIVRCAGFEQPSCHAWVPAVSSRCSYLETNWTSRNPDGLPCIRPRGSNGLKQALGLTAARRVG